MKTIITSNKFYAIASRPRFNGHTSPGTGVFQVVSGLINSSLDPGIARPGQNNPDILGSEQVVHNPGTG
jgi:hypothetical protein